MRYAAGVEYDGSAFCGWQFQPDQPTVQGLVEVALGQVAGLSSTLPVICAGRTDAGVHALNQIIHFDSPAARDEKAWVFGCNSQLPSSVAMKWVQPVSEEFHARFDAQSRRYRYLHNNARTRPAIAARQCGWSPRPLDTEAMHEAAQVLVGRHDFSAFRAAECQSKQPERKVLQISLKRSGDWLFLDIAADGFLHHMVRNILGSLLLIGQGDRPADWLQGVLSSRDRKQAGPTAAAGGLYFLGASYAPDASLPRYVDDELWRGAGLALPGPAHNSDRIARP